MRRTLLVIWTLLGLCSPAGAAGIAVYDALNFGQNVLQTLQMVYTVANSVLELAGVDTLSVDSGYTDDLAALKSVATDAAAFGQDVGSLTTQIQTLFDVHNAPRGSAELRQRLAAMRQAVFESYSYAVRTQTLLKTTLTTIGHLEKLYVDLGNFLGNQQGNQVLVQHEATLNKTLATLQTQTAALAHAQTLDRLTEPVTIEALGNIFDAQMEDHP